MPSSHTSEASVDPLFICDCEKWMRSACAKESFYKEHESKRYCVLHYPGKEKSVVFNEALQRKLLVEDFNFRGVWFPDKVDFHNFTFDAEVSFNSATFGAETDFDSVKFIAEADFASATFGAEANFSSVTFSAESYFKSVKFGAEAYFDSVKFIAKTDFASATFGAEVSFHRATFGAEVSFHGATFGAEAYFSGATFGTMAYFATATFSKLSFFREVTFGAEAYFNSTKFGAEAYFDSATFSAKTLFVAAKFSAAVSFNSAKFDAEASFNSVIFGAAAFFNSVTFSVEANFGSATFKDYVIFAADHRRPEFGNQASLSLQFTKIEKPERVSFHTLTLRPHWFVNVDARKFDLTNVVWRGSTKEEIQELHHKEIAAPRRLLAIAYRQLAVNAEENHRYEEASEFRYSAMDIQRRESSHGLMPWRLIWWYWVASGYGERVLRAFIVLLMVWLASAILYTQVGFMPREPKRLGEGDVMTAKRAEVDEPLDWSRATTYSLGVMALQKPEPRPVTVWAQRLVIVETILGPLQAALLALAIRRKFMR